MSDLDMNNPYYYAQNMLAGFDSDIEEVPPTQAYSPPPSPIVAKRKVPSKTAAKKRNITEDVGSFVICKKPRRGRRLIKIEVFDLTEESSSDVPALSAQHLVVDPIDEISDMTNNIVKHIFKRISDNF